MTPEVYSPGTFCPLNAVFSVRVKADISDVTIVEFFCSTPKATLITFGKVLGDPLLLFASKVSHRKLNVLIFHGQVCPFFLVKRRKKRHDFCGSIFFSIVLGYMLLVSRNCYFLWVKYSIRMNIQQNIQPEN